MKVTEFDLPGLKLIEPRRFGDARGWFAEVWQADRYREAGITETFVQDNLACSAKGVLRGLHIQHPHGQGKLVQVYRGRVFDVAVDVREHRRSGIELDRALAPDVGLGDPGHLDGRLHAREIFRSEGEVAQRFVLSVLRCVLQEMRQHLRVTQTVPGIRGEHRDNFTYLGRDFHGKILSETRKTHSIP